jgi:5-methylcytosine-specific restriction endonuclease McrA
MDEASRQLVRRRADERCEYCHLPQSGHEERFSIDHVVPRKHGGDDSMDNLALCCLRCNLHKGADLSGIDPNSNCLPCSSVQGPAGMVGGLSAAHAAINIDLIVSSRFFAC